MMTVEIIVFAGCVIPLLMFAVAVFACELRIQYRNNDTRRYPRYGKSDAMRTKGESRIKNEYEDNEA